jgi:hypothetical protein
MIYGVAGMLLVAAVFEAFWSSSRFIIPGVKFFVGAVCWLFVLIYLSWQGRPTASAIKTLKEEAKYAG